MNKQEQLLTIQDSASILSLSVRAVYRLIAEEKLPQPVKIGRASRLYTSDIDNFITQLKKTRT